MCDLFILLGRIRSFKLYGLGLILVFPYIFHAPTAFSQSYVKTYIETYEVIAREQRFRVVVAEDGLARRTGLMGVRYLQPNQGLLMVMPKVQPIAIWMKGMLISLDVVWISSTGEILDVMTLGPCLRRPCATYRSNRQAKYILEVGAGLFPLKSGDTVEILDTSRDSLFPLASDAKVAD